MEAIKEVAGRLGNRPATCRKYYVHPAILDAYSDGSLFDALKTARGDKREEAAVMTIVSARAAEAQGKMEPKRARAVESAARKVLAKKGA